MSLLAQTGFRKPPDKCNIRLHTCSLYTVCRNCEKPWAWGWWFCLSLTGPYTLQAEDWVSTEFTRMRPLRARREEMTIKCWSRGCVHHRPERFAWRKRGSPFHADHTTSTKPSIKSMGTHLLSFSPWKKNNHAACLHSFLEFKRENTGCFNLELG